MKYPSQIDYGKCSHSTKKGDLCDELAPKMNTNISDFGSQLTLTCKIIRPTTEKLTDIRLWIQYRIRLGDHDII